jgi:hypothetical protein
MSIQGDLLVRVTGNYQSSFPNPIRVIAGEEIVIDADKKTDITGWIWCTSREGKSGWVPVAYVEQRGIQGSMKCDYDAFELSVHIGELLKAQKMESGFYWVTDSKGRKGWVPVDHVEPLQSGKEVAK